MYLVGASRLHRGLVGLRQNHRRIIVRLLRQSEPRLEPNLILNEHAAILATAMTWNGPSFVRPNIMYIEYENVTNPTDVVSVPTPARDEGAQSSYYASMALHRDFLRVPIIAATPYTEDVNKYPKGNAAFYIAQTSGTQGFYGLAFSSGVNSKVFGCALGWAPDLGDRSKDLLYARKYYSSGQQSLKVPSSEVAVEWRISYRTP
jgi:hypothetical protein